MKIDPKIPANGDLQSDRVKNTVTSGVPAQSPARTGGAPQPQTEDTFQVSGRHAEVQQLTAQAASLPEVRTEKVAPLQARVQRGTYKPDSQKVADAIIADQARPASKS